MPYYGTSNGISHDTTENAERNATNLACEDVYLNSPNVGGGHVSGTFTGICEAQSGTLTIWHGRATGSSLCDGHQSSDYYTSISARCEYHYVY